MLELPGIAPADARLQLKIHAWSARAGILPKAQRGIAGKAGEKPALSRNCNADRNARSDTAKPDILFQVVTLPSRAKGNDARILRLPDD